MKIGFVSLPFAGHFNPMIALARRMQSRGHQIAFIGFPEVGRAVRAAGMKFVSYGEKEFSAGSFAARVAPIAKLHGLDSARWATKEMMGPIFEAASTHLPRALAESGVEALVLDMSHRYLELVPLSLGMPYAQVWNIFPIDSSGATPPCFVSRAYEDTSEARAQNIETLKTLGFIRDSMREQVAEYVKRTGLQIDLNDPAASISKLAIVSQSPKEFDFPANPWPPQFHFTGPFFDDAGREPTSFPWEKLDGRPLIYASLGTLVNGIERIHKAILAAAGRFPDVQAVLSVGGNVQLADLGSIPPNVIVVEKAPQIELLKRASLCITHAGFNTTLESLAHGVPMVAIPIGFDQPGVAARIAHHHVGEFIEVDDLNVDALHTLIHTVLKTSSYRENAQRFREIIAKRRGLDVAAEIIENALEKALAERAVALSRA